MSEKEDREYGAPSGDVKNPSEPFQITSMDITCLYPLTPRKNKYLLTFVNFH
jgi:hypothetical protein